LWIGYAGDGLGHFKAGHYHRLTTAAGISDDFISQILPDDRGNLWITGNRGLSRVSITDLDAVMAGRTQRVTTRAYGRVDGLPAMQPNRNNSPSAWRRRDGQLWFSMHSGLLVVQPQNSRDNPHPPPVLLERIRVDDRMMALYNSGSPLQTQRATNLINLRDRSKPIELGPAHRKVEIDFAALSFTSPENVQFRYRLTGFDNDWVEVGAVRRANYPRLTAGNYEFDVIACNNSGVWNESGATVNFVVTPFFYETWWFKLIAGLAMALLAAAIAFTVSRRRYRQKLRRIEARRALEQERARIARDIHDDLGATLTRISLLSQPVRNGAEDAEEAETTATTLARIHQTARDLTHAMGEVVWAVNPEHDTFDSLANYISSYAQNFLRAAGIRCRIEVPMQLPKQPLSAEVRHNLFLAFKESLNNVVKHAQASEVSIILAPQESGFDLSVADNGMGFTRESVAAQTQGDNPARPAPGNGLANMHSRLEELGGACELQSEPGTGTRVIFRVRLKATHGQP
jgi:signal transduction histidine kinase